MQQVTVACGQHIPEGDQGFMSATGTVSGLSRILQIWSTGPAPGTVTHVEVLNGSSTAAGVIAYANFSSAGVASFDWAGGATLNVDLTAFDEPGPGIHVSGQLVCGPSYTP